MALLQRTPSLGSIGGFASLVLGVAVALFVISQWDRARQFTGLSSTGTVA